VVAIARRRDHWSRLYRERVGFAASFHFGDRQILNQPPPHRACRRITVVLPGWEMWMSWRLLIWIAGYASFQIITLQFN
jgi:hypothetical protein